LAGDVPYVAEMARFNDSTWGDLITRITRIDVTYALRLHLVWQFPDVTIYSLATVDWQVVFRADTWPLLGLVIDSESKVTPVRSIGTQATRSASLDRCSTRRSHGRPHDPPAAPLRVGQTDFKKTFDWVTPKDFP